MNMFDNEFPFWTPFVYFGIMVIPFIFKSTFFAKRKNRYDDAIIVFVNITHLTTPPVKNDSLYVTYNPYYEEECFHLQVYLENENNYNISGILSYDIFKNHTVNQEDLEVTLFELRNFCDHCIYLNKKPFIVLSTNDTTYELFLNEYDIPNVINLKRMYGFFNMDEKTIPSLTPITMLNEIVTKKYRFSEHQFISKSDLMIHVLESW